MYNDRFYVFIFKNLNISQQNSSISILNMVEQIHEDMERFQSDYDLPEEKVIEIYKKLIKMGVKITNVYMAHKKYKFNDLLS